MLAVKKDWLIIKPDGISMNFLDDFHPAPVIITEKKKKIGKHYHPLVK
jgi:hypothetical protein